MRADFIEAVEEVVRNLDSPRRRVLEALLFAQNHSASAGQLKTLLGLSAVVQVNAAIGYIGRRVKEVLGAHPDGLADGDYEWWHVVATGSSQPGRGFVWKLREEIVAGLQASGLGTMGNKFPDEVLQEEALFEGALRQVTVNAYERNPVARTRCLEAYGCKCAVCEFDFGTTYGKKAEGFIHVHHIKALATIGSRYEVDPVQDLRPVCPNCHAVIHMTNPPREIEEVKAMLSGVAKPNSLFDTDTQACEPT